MPLLSIRRNTFLEIVKTLNLVILLAISLLAASCRDSVGGDATEIGETETLKDYFVLLQKIGLELKPVENEVRLSGSSNEHVVVFSFHPVSAGWNLTIAELVRHSRIIIIQRHFISEGQAHELSTLITKEKFWDLPYAYLPELTPFQLLATATQGQVKTVKWQSGTNPDYDVVSDWFCKIYDDSLHYAQGSPERNFERTYIKP